MGVEFELKYRADTDAQARLLQDFGPWQAITMATTYYDSPSGALAARKFTLRCRLENGYPICTFKTPMSETERGEFEVKGVTLPQALGTLAEESGAGYLTEIAHRLTPVCGARFTRVAKGIDGEGFVAELALDRGVLLGGGKELPLCEIELECKTGSENDFLSYAASLAARYSLQPEKLSKFARAAALAKGE